MNSQASTPRIGFICPRWLPSFGGSQIYTYRVVQALVARGFDARVFAGSAAIEGLDNGEIAATRHAPRGNIVRKMWSSTPQGRTSDELNDLFKHYDFMNAALEWASANEIDVAVIGHPFQQAQLHHVRELYTGLKSRGIKTGCLHFDLGDQLEDALRLVYLQCGSWEEAAVAVTANLNNLLHDHDALQAYFVMGSPLFLSPDFVISCSDWSGRFIDPDNRIPKMTLHPLQDAAYWGATSPEPALERFDVLMVNPQGRKGPQQMVDLIATSAPDWTFRILKGGWGNSLQRFIPKVLQLPAAVESRVEVRDYVKDMRQAYAAAGLLFFPSHYEGYGMTAVEPMYAGVPVVSSNYPAIIEAVGDGALACCPLRDSAQTWRAGVAQVLGNPGHWREKSLARAAQLQDRQVRELDELADFLAR